jgi:uncharacterized linocin/CFP29 family protein
MSDAAPSLTAEQWDRIRQVVHDEALRARVAASFLPLYGPLPGATETVPRNLLQVDMDGTLAVDDYDVLRIGRVSVNVVIKNHMLADPELAAAIIMFRRAAEIVARVEDAIVFNGKQGPEVKGVGGLQRDSYSLGGAATYEGLVAYGEANTPVPIARGTDSEGVAVFQAVVDAIQTLEGRGYFRPYACVLGRNLFTAINNPLPNSMVLPRDSIPPYLDGGPLLRSSCLPPLDGIVLSLSGDPAEIVVPSDISVRFLQTDLEGSHVFRVSQRFVLRVKEPGAIALIRL